MIPAMTGRSGARRLPALAIFAAAPQASLAQAGVATLPVHGCHRASYPMLHLSCRTAGLRFCRSIYSPHDAQAPLSAGPHAAAHHSYRGAAACTSRTSKPRTPQRHHPPLACAAFSTFGACCVGPGVSANGLLSLPAAAAFVRRSLRVASTARKKKERLDSRHFTVETHRGGGSAGGALDGGYYSSAALAGHGWRGTLALWVEPEGHFTDFGAKLS